MEFASDKTVEVGLEQGIVVIEGQNAGFMDPVRVLNASYELHEIKAERYYSRAFFTSKSSRDVLVEGDCIKKKKKKRKRKVHTPNEKEIIAENRHQEVRLVILKAYEAFHAMIAPLLRRYIALNDNDTVPIKSCSSKQDSIVDKGELNFVEMANLWQASLYEISTLKNSNIKCGPRHTSCKDAQFESSTLFNTPFENLSTMALVAQCGECNYLLPRLSKFLISDIVELRKLVRGAREEGFNLIVIDPPWENKSVHRKSLYPTIPNKYLLSLPIRKLAHIDGALVALWITNREKLRQFVERELFPSWGVNLVAIWYWLKVTIEGTMVSSLDLSHHKPYECLLLGYLPNNGGPTSKQETLKSTNSIKQVLVPNNYVLMSIPGDHSRKPPLKSLLSKYVPSHRIAHKGLELFARELNAGWTSWGNEPLHFQHMNYFRERRNSSVTNS